MAGYGRHELKMPGTELGVSSNIFRSTHNNIVPNVTNYADK